MITKSFVLAVLSVCVATGTFAHDGVKNPAVKARMDSMGTIRENVKLLGTMAKGGTAFDAAAAQLAAEAIAREAARTPGLFGSNEDDPLSEARASIWDSFDDFTAKAESLEDAAMSAQNIETIEDLATALPAIGASCKACHATYRE